MSKWWQRTLKEPLKNHKSRLHTLNGYLLLLIISSGVRGFLSFHIRNFRIPFRQRISVVPCRILDRTFHKKSNQRVPKLSVGLCSSLTFPVLSGFIRSLKFLLEPCLEVLEESRGVRTFLHWNIIHEMETSQPLKHLPPISTEFSWEFPSKPGAPVRTWFIYSLKLILCAPN